MLWRNPILHSSSGVPMIINARPNWVRRSLGKSVTRHAAGQGLVEYALILVFVAVVVLALLVSLGPGLGNVYSDIITAMQGAVG